MPAFSETTVDGSEITLDTPVPAGATGDVVYELYYRLKGSTNYTKVFAKLDTDVIKTRIQLPARHIEYFVRAIDENGEIFDTDVAEMHLLQSTSAYTYNENQAPAKAIVGETIVSKVFAFQLLKGAMVPGSVVNPTRTMQAPLNTGLAYSQSGHMFTTTAQTDETMVGTHHNDFAFGV